MLLFKGMVFMLIFALFLSRLIPKYVEFRETNVVNLLGVDWQGSIAMLVLLAVLALGMSVLIIGLRSFYLFFTRNRA